MVRPRRTGEASGSHLGRRARRPSPSLRHGGFRASPRLAHVLDSLVRVSRRAAFNHYASILDKSRNPQSQLAVFPRAITLYRSRATFPRIYPTAKTDAGPAKAEANAMSDQMPFPFNNFTYFFTLFSKFFSSFHHCTCSLSVSRQYLALDGIYHPLRAAFPNNSTRRKHFTNNWDPRHTGFSPSMTSCSKEHRQGPATKSPSSNYNSDVEDARFQI